MIILGLFGSLAYTTCERSKELDRTTLIIVPKASVFLSSTVSFLVLSVHHGH